MKKIFIILLVCFTTIILNASQNILTETQLEKNQEVPFNSQIINENIKKLSLTNKKKKYLENKKEITIHNAENQYSPEFETLLKDYYLKL